jgi:hypothetical protein
MRSTTPWKSDLALEDERDLLDISDKFDNVPAGRFHL